jgi:hypothetical protein
MNNALPWYRMYSEARTDAKLRALSDAEHRVWFHLLCFAAEQDGDGRGCIVGYDDELLAVELCDGDTALLRQTIERLKKLRILIEDENGITFCAFEKRQYDKPSDRPERVRARVAAYRERHRQDGNDDVTPCNASVSPRNAVQREREDTESDTKHSDPTFDISGEETARERTVAPVASALAAPQPTHGALALVPPSPSAKSSAIITRIPTPLKPVPKSSPAPRTARAPDLLWDACVLACDGNGPANDAERGKWNKGLKSLRQSGATPEEIALRAERYRRRYGDGIPLNPMALAGNWTVLSKEIQEVHDHGHTGNHNNGSGSNAGRDGRGDRRTARWNANTPKPLPDADYWEQERQRLEREGRLAKPRGASSGVLP